MKDQKESMRVIKNAFIIGFCDTKALYLTEYYAFIIGLYDIKALYITEYSICGILFICTETMVTCPYEIQCKKFSLLNFFAQTMNI